MARCTRPTKGAKPYLLSFKDTTQLPVARARPSRSCRLQVADLALLNSNPVSVRPNHIQPNSNGSSCVAHMQHKKDHRLGWSRQQLQQRQHAGYSTPCLQVAVVHVCAIPLCMPCMQRDACLACRGMHALHAGSPSISPHQRHKHITDNTHMQQRPCSAVTAQLPYVKGVSCTCKAHASKKSR
jgi:hypothetical protein